MLNRLYIGGVNMKKFYKDPEAELLLLEASVQTIIKSGGVDEDMNDHDNDSIDDLLNP